ncbi:MAG: oxygenase MpaB family protein [Solirubrobacterales bacterium]
MAADGYFDDDSMLRRVVGERIVVLSGPRALLMQAAHPLAMTGLLAHSGGFDDPYERLRQTAVVMDAIGFGGREEADRLTAQVRRAHARVRGRLREPAGPFPAGTPYAADDPALLLWVLYSLADSAMVVYSRYVAALSADEQERLWQDYRLVGSLFGLADDEMPADVAAMRAYGRERLDSGELVVTPWARDRGLDIVFNPPLPFPARPLVETVNFITVALLPPEIRRQFNFAPLPPDPIRSLMVRAGAEYVRRVALPLTPDRLRRIPQTRTA